MPRVQNAKLYKNRMQYPFRIDKNTEKSLVDWSNNFVLICWFWGEGGGYICFCSLGTVIKELCGSFSKCVTFVSIECLQHLVIFYDHNTLVYNMHWCQSIAKTDFRNDNKKEACLLLTQKFYCAWVHCKRMLNSQWKCRQYRSLYDLISNFNLSCEILQNYKCSWLNRKITC